MPNTLVTPTWVTNETALRFMNQVKGVANFNRSYDDSYRQAGAKVGTTLLVRMPVRGTVRRGQAWTPQALLEETKPVTLSYQSGYDFDWSTASETTEIDKVRTRYVNPAADLLASDADQQGMLDVYSSIYSAVGTPGVTPSSNLTWLNAGTKITDLAGPLDGRVAVLDPAAMVALVNANLTLFNPSAKVSELYRSGQFGRDALGVGEWYQDQNMPAHTTGTFTSSTPLVNGASQTGSSLATDGWASGVSSLTKGDIFTIDGVYSVNPISKVSTSRLQQFVVTANTSDSAGAMATLPISPSIITSGSLQTVSGSPANNAPINVWGNSGTYALSATPSKQSLLFHPDFSTFVMADLVNPVAGAKATFVRSKDYGINIRFIQQYLIGGDQNGSRLDILFGAAPLQERLGVRVVG